jgi:ribonuclease E
MSDLPDLSTSGAADAARSEGPAPSGSGTSQPSAAPTASGNGEAAGATGPNGAPRKRRRRRGGRGRGGRGGQGARPQSDTPGDDTIGSHDENDAAADRGLTADDLAAEARIDAGLEADADVAAKPAGGRAAAPRPQIGDTRPAPPASTTAPGGTAPEKKRRRRRRGGKGRGSGAGASPSFVDGSLDVGDTDVDGTAILETLDEKTLERRMGTTRKGRPAGRYLGVVHVHEDGVALMSVLEGRHLVEHYVSRPTDDELSIDGNIYLGRVQNVLPGMEAAFVDIGTQKNAVLYRSDVAFDAEDVDQEGGPPKIERMLKNGQSVLVQVTKNPIGHKGARLTQEVSLAGRFVVMVPGQQKTYGISKRLPDDERKRLRRILDRLRPADAGLIVRTAAEGATEDELRRDLERLSSQWSQIEQLTKRSKPGSLLYREPSLVVRVIREEFTKEYRAIVIDDPALHAEVRAYVAAVSPELAERVELYDPREENLPILEKFHVYEQLQKALDRKVWLPSGGALVIEHTEALTVIDVNTAKNVGRASASLEETVYANNLEAADVIARELRLRDIGGIIVIDFIDMEDESNRRAVERAFKDALARDKTRTQVYPISELGLLQMTRKRIGEGMVDLLSKACPNCAGRGYLVEEHLLD